MLLLLLLLLLLLAAAAAAPRAAGCCCHNGRWYCCCAATVLLLLILLLLLLFSIIAQSFLSETPYTAHKILARLGVALPQEETRLGSKIECSSAQHAMILSACHPELLKHLRNDAIKL